jgi:hypothetical protein
VCRACRLKLLPGAPWQLDGKSAAKLNQSYSLQEKVLPLLQQHDELTDLLSQLALEVKQAVAVDRDIEAKVRAVPANSIARTDIWMMLVGYRFLRLGCTQYPRGLHPRRCLLDSYI